MLWLGDLDARIDSDPCTVHVTHHIFFLTLIAMTYNIRPSWSCWSPDTKRRKHRVFRELRVPRENPKEALSPSYSLVPRLVLLSCQLLFPGPFQSSKPSVSPSTLKVPTALHHPCLSGPRLPLQALSSHLSSHLQGHHGCLQGRTS